MLNELGFFLGLISLIAGAALLFEGVSNAEASQTKGTSHLERGHQFLG
jgi:hypothetical protein